ncbi:g protein-coupled receptor-related [Anaeramoeba flamelloides]|uniref:G protein-coupled receptor-related n=1 Tax=Anaeramoeba flamelloides TaxID=1746091 RepID=A0ABQ8X340_9EUKA|nr:g protein-coupled receptor-related [Anaeramoeba flamelloides]
MYLCLLLGNNVIQQGGEMLNNVESNIQGGVSTVVNEVRNLGNNNLVRNAQENIQQGIEITTNTISQGTHNVIGSINSESQPLLGTLNKNIDEGARLYGTGVNKISDAFGSIQTPFSNLAHAKINDFTEFCHSQEFRQFTNLSFENVGDAYTMSKVALATIAIQVIGYFKWAFDFVKFDIFRDFFQILSLFLHSIPDLLPDSFLKFWGGVASAIAISFNYIRTTPLVWFWLTLVLVWISFLILKKKTQGDPDLITDGHEVRKWKKRSKTERYLAQILLTIIISLYLPVSKNCIEVISCYGDNNTFKKVFAKKGGCWKASHATHAVFSIFTMLLVTFYVPYWGYKLIKKNKPKPIEYDEEGIYKEYTDQDYQSDLDNDKCPYKFLYKGYERKWAFYKVIIMFIKFALIIPTVLISQKLAQVSITMSILFIFACLSFITAPFISKNDDRMDQSARLTTLITIVVSFCLVIFSKKEKSHYERYLSIGLNVVHGLNILILGFYTLLSLSIFQKKWKNLTGRIDFSKEDLEYDLQRERKLRIWHPFWEGLFRSDPKYENIVKRLNKEKLIVAQLGVSAYQNGLVPISRDAMLDRMFAQKFLEGVDVYWDGVDPKTNQVESETCFGKMWIDPFPFRATMVYDDADPVVLEDDDFYNLCRLNKTQDIINRRSVRINLRALHGQTVYFYHTETHTKSVGKGANKKTVRIEFTFKYGVFKVKANKDLPWAPGFHCAITYKDGEGTYQGKTYSRETTTIGNAEIGITPSFYMSDKLKRLIENEDNFNLIQQNLPNYLEELQAYRDELIYKRLRKQETLSWGFWYFVFNNDRIPRQYLEKYLEDFEVNEHLLTIIEDHREGLDYIYGKLRFYDSHPACSYWYCFWDDLWSNNYMMKRFKSNEQLFSPRFSSCLCYRPMNRVDLEQILDEHNLKGKISKKILNKLYEMMEIYSDGDSQISKYQIPIPGNQFYEFKEVTFENFKEQIIELSGEVL